MSPLRHLAPAGAPIRAGDLVRWAALDLPGRNVARDLRERVCERFEVRHAFLFATGRAALTVLLRAFRRLAGNERDEVILPSYTCYSVAASVVKAGLRPRLVDISPESLDYEPTVLSRTDFSGVLAVVATNLYGLPNDLEALTRLARDRGVFLIDDAAQAMGASLAGRWCGTWGDAGLYSFDKGKNVSAIDGGVVVTNSDAVASAVQEEIRGLTTAPLQASATGVIKALAYWLLLRPSAYWIPNRAPGLGLGRTVFTTDFPLEAPPRALSALASTVLRRLEYVNLRRTQNATQLMAALRGVAGITLVTPAPTSDPVYLRLPIIVDDASARDVLMARLVNAGIGATASYPRALIDVPEIRHFLGSSSADTPGGRFVADRILTLPTHPFVDEADIGRMSTIVRRVLERRPQLDVVMQ